MNSYKVEAFDYVQFLFEKYHDHQMHGFIELNSFIDENILRKSFLNTLKDLPQLVCKMENDRWIPVSYDVKKIVKVIKCDLSEDNIMATIVKNTNTLNGPQISITVLRGIKNDVVCIVMNHMLCDGMAFKKYLYLLCSIYNSIKENASIKKRYSLHYIRYLEKRFHQLHVQLI